MGYCHAKPSKYANKIYMIIILWEKYRYKFLPMGVSNSPEHFKKNELPIPRVKVYVLV